MGNPQFTRKHRIRFSECDPAAIVFYPQYFIMFNDMLEAWIDELLPEGFNALITSRRVGLPTVRLEVDFRAISRMGDDVVLSLEVGRVGNKSLNLLWQCAGEAGDVRMTLSQTVVTTSLETHRSISIPDDLKQAIQARQPA